MKSSSAPTNSYSTMLNSSSAEPHPPSQNEGQKDFQGHTGISAILTSRLWKLS